MNEVRGHIKAITFLETVGRGSVFHVPYINNALTKLHGQLLINYSRICITRIQAIAEIVLVPTDNTKQ